MNRFVACLLLLTGCEEEPPRRLEVEVACTGWAPGPRCFAEEPMGIRVESSERPHIEGTEVTWTRRDDAWFVRTVASRDLVVRAGDAEATIRLVTDPRDVIADARRLRDGGDLDAADRALRSLQDSTDPLARALVRGERGRVALRRGDDDDAYDALHASSAELRDLGEGGLARNDFIAAAWVCYERLGDLDRAERLLRAAAAQGDVEGRARVAYHMGALALQRGDRRRARESLESAASLADALGLRTLQTLAQSRHAELLQDLGAGENARVLLRALPVGDAPCARGMHYSALAWSALRSETPVAELDSWLDEALADPTCGPRERANAHVNAALRALEQGDVDDAEAHLVRASEGGTGGTVAAWSAVVRGAAHLAADRPRDALAVFDDLRARATLAGMRPAEWHACVGRGTALRRLGDARAAEASFEEAEAILEREVVLTALLDGGTALGGMRRASLDGLVALLVERGRDADALDAIREARSRGARTAALDPPARADLTPLRNRVSSGLDAGAWTLSAEALAERRRTSDEVRRELLATIEDARALSGAAPFVPRPVGPDELLVAHHAPYLFVATATGVESRRLDTPPRDAEGFWAEVRRVTSIPSHLRLLTGGLADALDAHTAESLGERTCVYEVGVHGARAPTAEGGILLATDAAANLRAARVEERLVQSHAAEHDLSVSTDPTELMNVETAHFAVHGDANRVTGTLRLGGEQELDSVDVLSMRRVPRRVVLNGCDTASGELGLAQAFVIAGSSEVLAADRPIEDVLALDVARSVIAARYDLTGASAHLRGESLVAFRVLVP